MDKINNMLFNLKNKIPFALARFNDGEMAGIRGPGCTVARGDQYVNAELSELLGKALQFEKDGYWKGLPCSICWPDMRKLADSLIDKDYPYLTSAVVTTNRNWLEFTGSFQNIVKDYGLEVNWISGDDQDLTRLPFDVAHHYQVPTKDAFNNCHSEIYDKWVEFNPGSIIVMSCGPLSRILAWHYWKYRDDCTYLDVGSAFDPFTRGVRHNCHIWEDGRNRARPCKECN